MMKDLNEHGSGLVTLMVCRNELEAQNIRATLEDGGIPAFVFEKGGLGMGPMRSGAPMGGVQVQVPAELLDDARSALELSAVDSARIDWDEIDVGEPPPEVSRVLSSRGVMHGFRSFIVTIGPIIGLGLLIASLLGAIIIILF